MTANGQKRFMRDFAHRLRQKPPGALYLFLDEADEFLPQEKVKGTGGAATDTNLFGDLKWMVRRGRLNGFRVVMITQRPAEIAKAVLTQIETLVAHRLTAPQDRKAIEEWVKGHADPDAHKEVLSSLASLEKGVAWVWAPDLDILTKAKMPQIETFDSGRTPEPGEIEVAPPALADLDLSAIEASLAAVVEEAKANDPKALKAEVARLTRELAAASKGVAPSWPDQRELVKTLTAELEENCAAMERLTANAKELQRRQETALAALSGESVPIPAVTAPQRRPAPAPAPVQRQPAPVREARQREDDSIPPGTRSTLGVLASTYPAGMTPGQLAARVGIKKKGSTFSAYKSRLRTAGLIEERDGLLFATERGVGLIGDVEPLPAPGPELARSWASKLPGTGALVEHLLLVYPTWADREELADALGINRSGSTLSAYISRLSTAGVIEKSGASIRLSDAVMA